MPLPIGKVPGGGCPVCCLLGLVMVGRQPDPYLPSPLLAALSKAAEVYFKAIEKIGEQALQSSTSHVLGKALLLAILCPVMSHSYIFLAFPP